MNFPITKYTISGESMSPTFPSGTTVLASTIAYYFSSPKKGQVIIVSHPENNKPLIKRIAKVQEEKVFVLGDNKYASTDSRQFGWIERKQIVGKVFCILS